MTDESLWRCTGCGVRRSDVPEGGGLCGSCAAGPGRYLCRGCQQAMADAPGCMCARCALGFLDGGPAPEDVRVVEVGEHG